MEIQALDNLNYYQMLFNFSPTGLALCRMNGELVDVNPSYAALVGWKVEEILGKTYWDFTPQKYNESEQKILEDINTKGKYGPYEKEYIHKDGHLVPVRLSGIVFEKEGNRYIWSSVEDITAQKRSEKKIYEKNIALKEILSQIEVEKKSLEEKVVANIDYLLAPIIKKIATHVKPGGVKYLELLQENLENMIDSFGCRIGSRNIGLTPSEMEVCQLIKNGLRTKDIAQFLNISPLTVETHRNRIRKKLGIANRSINLATHLQNF